jgi:RimJ/RimL family protein N-acetyltransferase
MTKLTFQVMQEDELVLCLQFLHMAAMRLKNDHINQWAYWLDPPQDKIDWVKEGILNHEFYKVYDKNGQLHAIFRLLVNDELYWGIQKEEARYIHSLVVSDSSTGKNIGSSIIQMIENSIKEEGINRLRLDCNAENPKLCQYYEKLGFVKVGTVKMPYSLNNLYEKMIY